MNVFCWCGDPHNENDHHKSTQEAKKTNMTRIQFKVYDETGRRHYVQEINIPVSISGCSEYIKQECKRLQNIAYPKITVADDSGKEKSLQTLDFTSIERSVTEKLNISPSDPYRVENHHSPTGHSPGIRT